MSTIKISTAVLLGASLLAGTNQAFAQSGSPQCASDSVQLQTTNWNSAVTIPKFDPSEGMLTKVEFKLTGAIFGSAAIESLDAQATTVTTDYQSAITLTRPDLSVLVVATPVENFVDNLSASDGVIDFGGTSGVTHGNISTQEVVSIDSYAAADLILFSGPAGNPGTIVLPIDAVGSSTASGSGNLITQFLTNAGASVEVCYYFEPDCNGNGIADVRDVLPTGSSNDNNTNGIPDECEPSIRTFCEGSGSQSGGADCPCNNNGGVGEGCENGTGMGGLLTATGNPSVSNDTLLLTATQIPLNAPGFFWFANTQPGVVQSGVGVPFGMGLRCISNPILIRKLNNGGTVPLPGDPAISIAQGIDAGDTTYFQYWYRNNNGPCGVGAGSVNATNGVEVVWGL
ncbi:MAG: hypothetical protein ACI8X5_001696 [Planctomycetota bacterium]|jgi:hypothetical protein